MNKTSKHAQIKVVLGAGGVGKTTVSAMLGIEHARHGHRVLVITLDPARRLLDALDIKPRASGPSKVALDKFLEIQPGFSGSLHAFMPDLKKEWRNFLEESTHHVEALHEIADNPFYQYMVEGLPGALEIICSHILYRFIKSSKYDLIILDTPPSSNSISFLDVPSRVSALLEQNIFRTIFSKKNSVMLKISRKLAFFSGNIIEKTIERLIGSHFFSELIDFALSIDSLYEPMLERTRAMQDLLVSQHTSYVLVCRPDLASVDDCKLLNKSLAARNIFISEVIINQMMVLLDQAALRRELGMLAKKPGSKKLQLLMEKLIGMHQDILGFEEKQKEQIEASFVGKKINCLFMKQYSCKEEIISELLADYGEHEV